MPNPPGKKTRRVRGCSVKDSASIEPTRHQFGWSQDDFAFQFSVWASSQRGWPYAPGKLIDRSVISRAQNGEKIERKIARLLDAFVEHLRSLAKEQPSPSSQRCPMPSSAEPVYSFSQPPALCEAARHLLDRSKKAYIQGFVRQALELVTQAKAEKHAWPHIRVGSQLVTCLLRYGHSRWADIRTALDELACSNPVGRDLDRLHLLRSDFLARQKNWDAALNDLSLIHVDSPQGEGDRDARYIAARRDYQQGMCHLALTLSTFESNIVAARSCFSSAHRLHRDWWYVTLNLALVDRINNRPQTELEQQARKDIENAIQKHPMKSSARFYRLLHIIMTGTERDLKLMIDEDHAKCPSTLEVSQDFYDTMALRVRLLHGTSAKSERILKELLRWPEKPEEPFFVLK